MKPKVVVFDLDDTIINTTQMIFGWHGGAYEKFKKYLSGVSKGEFEVAVETAVREVFSSDMPVYRASVVLWFKSLKRLGITPVPNLVYGLYVDLQTYTAKNCRLEPGFNRLYERLKGAGVKVGVLSNGGFWEKGVKIKEIGLGDDDVVVVSTDIVGVDKPDPKAFRYILEILEVKPSEAVMVGDNYEADYLGAKRVGMRAVWYVNETKGMKLADYSIKEKVNHHDQVWNIIEQMK